MMPKIREIQNEEKHSGELVTLPLFVIWIAWWMAWVPHSSAGRSSDKQKLVVFHLILWSADDKGEGTEGDCSALTLVCIDSLDLESPWWVTSIHISKIQPKGLGRRAFLCKILTVARRLFLCQSLEVLFLLSIPIIQWPQTPQMWA